MKYLTQNQKISFLTAFIYTALIGAGMYTSYHINGTSYNNPRMVETLMSFEIVMTLFAVVMAVKYFSWHELGFRNVEKKNLIWFAPMGVVVAVVLFTFVSFMLSNTFTPDQLRLFTIAGITTLLVGFSEELVYRGIVFATFLKESKVQALFVSGITFSLLHSVNVFGGLEFAAMLGQLGITFIAGLFFAFVRLKIKSIVPIIIFHWVWDFNLIGGQVLHTGEINSTFTTAFVVLEIIFVFTYVPYFVYQERKKKSNTSN